MPRAALPTGQQLGLSINWSRRLACAQQRLQLPLNAVCQLSAPHAACQGGPRLQQRRMRLLSGGGALLENLQRIACGIGRRRGDGEKLAADRAEGRNNTDAAGRCAAGIKPSLSRSAVAAAAAAAAEVKQQEEAGSSGAQRPKKQQSNSGMAAAHPGSRPPPPPAPTPCTAAGGEGGARVSNRWGLTDMQAR